MEVDIKRIVFAVLFMTLIVQRVEAKSINWSYPTEITGTIKWYSDIEKLRTDIVALHVTLSPESIDSCYRQEANFSRFQSVTVLRYSPNFYHSTLKETDSLAESYLISKLSEMKKISTLYVDKINRQYDFSGFKYVENLGFNDCSNSSCLNNTSILKLKYITDLNISDTRFEKVQADTLIFNLENLKILEIDCSFYYSGNSFGQIPYSYIGNLTSIFSLKINDPNILKIPKSWENLHNLLYLDISTDMIDSIPAFLSKKIERLDLSIDKGIPVFDASIFEIRNLGIQLYNIVDNQLDKSRVSRLKKQIKITNKSTKEKVVIINRKFKMKDQIVNEIYITRNSF